MAAGLFSASAVTAIVGIATAVRPVDEQRGSGSDGWPIAVISRQTPAPDAPDTSAQLSAASERVKDHGSRLIVRPVSPKITGLRFLPFVVARADGSTHFTLFRRGEGLSGNVERPGKVQKSTISDDRQHEYFRLRILNHCAVSCK